MDFLRLEKWMCPDDILPLKISINSDGFKPLWWELMNIGVCKINLHLPQNLELKGKRKIIGSLRARIHNKFNVSIAEVENNDSWQRVTLGITVASNNGRHASKILNNIVDFIINSRGDFELISDDREILSGF